MSIQVPSLDPGKSSNRGQAILLLCLSGLLIVIIVFLLSLTGILDEAEFSFVTPGDFTPTGDTVSVTRVFTLVTGDDNPTKYLNDLCRIAAGLKNNGARVMIAEMPTIVSPRPTVTSLLDSLRAMKFVVLYDNWQRVGATIYPPDKSPSVRKGEFVPLIRIVNTLSSSSQPIVRPKNVIRWSPCVFNGYNLMEDVSLAATARYSGLPDSARPSCQPNQVLLGKIDIPVQSDGHTMSLLRPQYSNLEFVIWGNRDLDTDSLRFYSYKESHEVSLDVPGTLADVRGKIIVIQWRPASHGNPNLFAGFTQAMTIESLRHHDFVTEIAWLWLAITAGIVLLGAVLRTLVRQRYMIFILLGLGVGLFFIGIWVLISQLVLLSMAYPALAAFLSAGVFPLMRFPHSTLVAVEEPH